MGSHMFAYGYLPDTHAPLTVFTRFGCETRVPEYSSDPGEVDWSRTDYFDVWR